MPKIAKIILSECGLLLLHPFVICKYVYLYIVSIVSNGSKSWFFKIAFLDSNIYNWKTHLSVLELNW